MKIILDTNIIVSALIQRSYPFFVVDKIFVDSSLKLQISDALFKEYVEVLHRDKFKRYTDFFLRSKVLLSDIYELAEMVQTTTKLNIIKDSHDNRLLELAEASNADFIVTGNTNDFKMKKYKITQIVSAKEMFELLFQ
ncbi:MAG: putative toxin-antitoxin system toxin component, PIN family [Bacteroidetes bacterium]|nr:putative toxin-antitoxin system toxin component, PIN family [Bacteroidota bacterium]